MRYRSLCSQTMCVHSRFWSLIPAPVFGGQQCRWLLLDADGWREEQILGRKTKIDLPPRAALTEDEKATRDKILEQIWKSTSRTRSILPFRSIQWQYSRIPSSLWTILTDNEGRAIERRQIDTKEVRLGEGWPRACGSSQQLKSAMVKGTWISSRARKE